MLMLGGCGSVTAPRAKDANNQMMLVRKEPASLGYRKLAVKAGVYPDLDYFLGEFGMPDFFAELSNGDRLYLVFYYLHNRQAIACRTKSRQSRDVEFIGPYTMTPHEFEMLGEAKRSAVLPASATR